MSVGSNSDLQMYFYPINVDPLFARVVLKRSFAASSSFSSKSIFTPQGASGQFVDSNKQASKKQHETKSANDENYSSNGS